MVNKNYNFKIASRNELQLNDMILQYIMNDTATQIFDVGSEGLIFFINKNNCMIPKVKKKD